jgi:small subunit ribosomal protein S16
MVRIRFRRVGLKGQPSYRIVAADKESPRDGRFLENMGFYNPRTNPTTLTVKEDRVYHWMKNGAKPTESVEQVFKTAGVLDRFERFKKGEDLETLLKEAAEAQEKRNVTEKTRPD